MTTPALADAEYKRSVKDNVESIATRVGFIERRDMDANIQGHDGVRMLCNMLVECLIDGGHYISPSGR